MSVFLGTSFPTTLLGYIRAGSQYAHVRMILDVSVFPAPDSPDTTMDWLAALRPAPRRIWWYASCKMIKGGGKCQSTVGCVRRVVLKTIHKWCTIEDVFTHAARFKTMVKIRATGESRDRFCFLGETEATNCWKVDCRQRRYRPTKPWTAQAWNFQPFICSPEVLTIQ